MPSSYLHKCDCGAQYEFTARKGKLVVKRVKGPSKPKVDKDDLLGIFDSDEDEDEDEEESEESDG